MLHGLAAFLSAFLLFFVQPFICKAILPWFGGGATVWITCMLFFQVVLLIGYGYAHLLVVRLDQGRQKRVHGALILLALTSLGFNWILSGSPFGAPDWLRPSGPDLPVLRVMLVLACSVGLPGLVLSANAPLVQAWFVRQRPGTDPYRLYALSNLGSFMGLLAYPAIVEPLLLTRIQGWSLAGLFVVFAGVLAVLSRRPWAQDDLDRTGPSPEQDRPSAGMVARWIGLSGLGSALFLSTNSYLGYAFYSLPLLWVLPLALYLLTFVLCFEFGLEIKRPLPSALATLLTAGALAATPVLVRLGSTWLAIAAALLGLVLSCLLVHGHLARLKPTPRHLTKYFLCISTGGLLGGLLLNLLTPQVFAYPWEMSLFVTLAALLFAARAGWSHAPAGTAARMSALATVGVCLWAFRGEFLRSREGRFKRDYYAIHQIQDVGSFARIIQSARTLHGVQYFHERKPIGYYSERSGLGLAMARARKGLAPLRLGILGLGAGGALAYLRPGDAAVAYEISPAVRDMAVPDNAEFSYWSTCPAKLELVMGDGRLSLSEELKSGSRQFDILLVDAFSGGNIPCHLLTQECLELYLAHLKPGGILVMHLSNTLPVARRAMRTAQSLDLWALQVLHGPTEADCRSFRDLPSDYLLAARRPESILSPESVREAVALVGPARIEAAEGHPLRQLQDIGQIITRGLRPWQDQRHSIMDLVWLDTRDVSGEVDAVLNRARRPLSQGK